MDSSPGKCDLCGKELKVGDWPFCPHPSTAEGMGMLGKFSPYFDEHVSHSGAWVTSLAQRKRLMKENALDYRGKKVGMPGCEV